MYSAGKNGQALLSVLALVSVLACDKLGIGGSEAAKEQAEPPAKQPSTIDKDATEQPKGTDPVAVEPVEPAGTAEPAEPVVEPTPTARTLESIAASVEQEKDASTTGWTHFKAKDYAAALPYFAQASLAEPAAWKHPYNLACAAALAGDHEVARLGLSAAVTRDREATANKARRDADLASVRDEPWFEPTLSGEPADAAPPEPPIAKAKPLAKTQLDQLIAQLEAKHGVRPIIRASITHVEDGGVTQGWALFSITKMDECLKTSTQQKCTKKLSEEGYAIDFNQTKCAHEYVVRARFADELTITESRALKLPCKLGNIRRFDLADVDADGAPEIVVDVTGQQLGEGVHEAEFREAGRQVRVLRLDDTAQFELTVEWTIAEAAPGHERSQTFNFTDENGDGHPDLFIETKEFVGISDLAFDDALWLTSEVDEEAVGPYSSQMRYYKPDVDEWGPPVAGP